MARPIKSDPRIKQLNLSLTTSELEDIERRARAIGMRPVHFGRALLLENNLVPNPAEVNPTRLIHIQLVRIGNNLNQLLRYLHRNGRPVPAELEPLLREIRQTINRVSP